MFFGGRPRSAEKHNGPFRFFLAETKTTRIPTLVGGFTVQGAPYLAEAWGGDYKPEEFNQKNS